MRYADHMTGTELKTFCIELNGGASIGDTLLEQFVNLARAMVEQSRDWMILRKTDTSKTVTTGGTWQTAIDLSTIARINRFYGDYPVKLFDGTNSIERYRRVPTDQRLEYRESSDTFVYNDNAQQLYLNGTSAIGGTLWINYITESEDIDLTEDTDDIWPLFPTYGPMALGFIAVAMYKGGVDYDDLNRIAAQDNSGQAQRLLRALDRWDDERQLSAVSQHDPYQDSNSGFRSGHIDI